ncbi:MAG: outer membrane lipoprotein-sorting protein [Candidatus Electrothrix aestuarii]|uniref:Outer membrane lipoprotein-sorting protein n=1 Tax=Candidatus Electrothrix aestuarii TaxID=3062594 RepID=A0AAU8LPV8_9BACT|nr:outer membrane lipoprotein-sorting protein [Candidatus Electrothrix aestuarii]
MKFAPMFSGLLLLHLVFAPCSGKLCFAETPEEKGRAIVLEAERRDQGFGDVVAEMEMILRNKNGQESRREMTTKTLEVKNDGDKNLSLFHTPRDIRGTALLTFSHKNGDDEQWLYLPALKRVKRINSRNKSGSFVGSEFSYEDISSQEIEEYTYKYLRDEDLDGVPCTVSEYYPVDAENSGYKHQVVWRDKEEYQIRKVDFYDRKDSLLKTLTMKGYQQYEGKFWRAGELHMVNHQSGKSTVLHYSKYQFHTGLTDKDFNKNSLKNAR